MNHGIALDDGRHGHRGRGHDSTNLYVTGATASPNFPTTPGSFQPTNAGNFDAFVTKLSTGDRRDPDDKDDHDRDRHDDD